MTDSTNPNLAIPFIVLNPLVLYQIASLITVFALGFTLPRSALRLAGLVAVSVCAWYAIAGLPVFFPTSGYPGRVFGGAIFTLPVLYFDRLILKKWSYDTHPDICKTSKEKEQKNPDLKVDDFSGKVKKTSSFWSRFAFGQAVTTSPRGIGTSWEAKNVPSFSARDPKYVPFRTEFIAKHSFMVLAIYLVHDYALDTQLGLDRSLLSPVYVPFFQRIGDVSWAEIPTRYLIAISYWITQYCILEAAFSIFAIIGACFNPNDLELWPPLFGSLLDAYTVRGFWGKFWHQNLRVNLEGPSRFITHSILRLPSRSLAARYTNIFFVFFISGALHVASDMGGCLSFRESGALRFFCTQAFGIMVEDAAQELYRRVQNSSGRSETATPVWPKIFGFIWVVSFLAWSSAVWIYPMILNTKREDAVLGFSAFRPFSPF